MRVIGLVALTACWTGTQRAAPVPTSCTIAERLVDTEHAARLSFRHQQFATLEGPFVRIEMTMRGSEATARVETEEVVLEGQLGLDELPLRPKQIELRDGWLEVTRAIGRAALDSSMRLEVELPVGLMPRWTSIDMPCDALTFAKPPEAAMPDSTNGLELKPGKSAALYREPGARPIGTWSAPKRDPGEPYEHVEAILLRRSGDYTQIRIPGPNAVVAWVHSNAGLEVIDEDVYGGLLGNEVGDMGRRLQCRSEVAVFVRVDGEVHRVGTVKPHVEMTLRGVRGDELEIELGDAVAKPFVRRRDIAGCVTT